LKALHPIIRIRSHQVLGEFERLKIQFDGKEVGELGNNDEILIPAEKGFHTLSSNGLWRKKVYPIKFLINDDEDVEFCIEPVSGKIKYQFYMEIKVPAEKQLDEINLRKRRIAWDLKKDLFTRKINKSCIYFDLENFAYYHPLRFMFNIDQQNLVVYANRKQDIVLYRSEVEKNEADEGCWIKTSKYKNHAFYGPKDKLLGTLFQECDQWFVSTADKQEKIAEICPSGTKGHLFSNYSHYLRSLTGGQSILAYKKWIDKNMLQFWNTDLPIGEHHEILMLAFITFSVLYGNEIIENSSEKIIIKEDVLWNYRLNS
jgi:hypothetical protein